MSKKKPSPLVAIVGRPNVGKSTLFNHLTGSRRAIVGDEPGITRDRLYAKAELFGKQFELIDTGGIDAGSTAPFNEQIKQQALYAIEEADAIIFVVDAQVGPTLLDDEAANGADAVKALKKGETTPEPVQTQYGWHIIKLEDTRDVTPPPFDQVKAQVSKNLIQKKLVAYVEDMKKAAKIDKKPL